MMFAKHTRYTNTVCLCLPKKTNGEITLTDTTNNKTYTGTYKMTEETSKTATYEIEIDGIAGDATIAITEHLGNRLTPTLPINLGEYTVYFLPNEADTK